MTKKKILITSALPYANGPLHFGHIAGAYLPGDCYARFMRLQQAEVLYVCGSDEYGMAITLSAEKAGRSPKEHVDKYHALIHGFFNTLNLSFDHYSRTTWEGHIQPVQQMFLDLLENGWIKEGMSYQLYSEKEQRFLADRYVEGQCPNCGFEKARGDECQKCGASYEAIDLIHPLSKMTGSPLIKKKTKHWFLQLDKMKDKLLKWIEGKDWKPHVLNFIKKYIEDLRPRAITRDSNWGVPLPLENTEGKVLYVWFDAPIGYITSSMQWAEKQGNKDKWKDFWCDENTQLVHFIGKDNITFHGVIFPAMIMGQNLPLKLVDELPANEFYNLEGRQFSKSDGWYIDLEDFFQHFSADQIRYAIAANAPENSDSEFTWKDFQMRCNQELLGKLGNFIHRTLVFIQKQAQGVIPSPHSFSDQDQVFEKELRESEQKIKEAYKQFKLRQVTQGIMDLCQKANSYFDHQAPWKAAKDPVLKAQLDNTLYLCAEAIKCLALFTQALIPSTSCKIWKMLGLSFSLAEMGWERALQLSIQQQKLGVIETLFERVEDELIQQMQEKLQAQLEPSKHSKNLPASSLKPTIAFQDFEKLDLRVALITAAEKVKKSKKLLRLQVDIGSESRQIVSGISQYYPPEDLIGKKVIVVANLKSATLMGIESQGMILAASLDEALEVAFIQDSLPGTPVS